MVRTRLGVALLAAAGLLVAGCARPAVPGATGAPTAATASASAGTAPGASQSDPAGPAASDAAADACRLVTQAMAAEFVGAAVQPPQLSDRGDATACIFAAHGGGPGTLGVTVFAAAATRNSLSAVASAAPDAHAVAGLDNVLVAAGAAWLVSGGHLVSLVLVHPDGGLGSATEMRDLVRAIRVATAAPTGS